MRYLCPPPGLQQIVILELCQMGSQGGIICHQQLLPAHAVQLPKRHPCMRGCPVSEPLSMTPCNARLHLASPGAVVGLLCFQDLGQSSLLSGNKPKLAVMCSQEWTLTWSRRHQTHAMWRMASESGRSCLSSADWVCFTHMEGVGRALQVTHLRSPPHPCRGRAAPAPAA